MNAIVPESRIAAAEQGFLQRWLAAASLWMRREDVHVAEAPLLTADFDDIVRDACRRRAEFLRQGAK